MDSQARIPEFESHLCHLLAVLFVSKLFNPSVTQFPHLNNEDNNSYLVEFLMRIK